MDIVVGWPLASLALVAGWVVAAGAQQKPGTNLPLEPLRERGTSITPAFEGWYENADGSFSLLLGYYNRNTKETFDIPVGPNNKVEPGAGDQGQPTHFEIGRQWGVFVVKVPKDFGAKAVTWTIVLNGETQSIPFTLNKGYPDQPVQGTGHGQQAAGPGLCGRRREGHRSADRHRGHASRAPWASRSRSASGWKTPKPPPKGRAEGAAGSVWWPRCRSISSADPGKVTFDKARIPVTKQGDMITAAATFTAPGDYLLRVQANDESGEGGGGFQCCWTNTYLKVTVK